MSPVWICHRGVRDTGFIENTLEAYQEAVRRGFRVLETDLRVTTDGHIVLSHDPDLDRVGDDVRHIKDMSRSDLEKIRLPNGQKILFLDQFLKEFPDCQYVFDVKPETSRRTLETLVKFLAARSDEVAARVTFLLWRTEDISFVSEFFPASRRFAGERECQRAGVSILFFGGCFSGVKPGIVYSIPPVFAGRYLFTRETVERYHRLGAKVLAYLPRHADDAKAALEAGFDEILSDGVLLNV